jgi:alanyl-tRNA synthetase
MLANHRLIHNDDVTTTVTSRRHAEELGALAFFGDKYGDSVRVVQVGDYSLELCGGTHTRTAGEVGPLIVLGESSIGSNLRRVEALTGEAAYDHLAGVRAALDRAGGLLRTGAAEVPARVEGLLRKVEELEDQLEAMRAARRGALAEELAAGAEPVGEARLVARTVGELAPDQLRRLALGVRDRVGRGVVVLGSTSAGKGSLVAAITRDLRDGGVSAAEILAGAARLLGGGASRDPELAQAGGPRGDQLAAAVGAAHEAAGRALRGE